MEATSAQECPSGLGKGSPVPEEIKGWNWGAFFLNWIWGIGNSTYVALLVFIPFVNFVMPFVLGAKGNQWAWQNRMWRDVDHFKSVQKKWRNAVIILFFIVLPLFFVLVANMLKGDAYDLSLKAVTTNAEVIEIIGLDAEPSFFVTGEIKYNSEGGKASLHYSLDGAKGSVEVYLLATNLGNSWQLDQLIAVDVATGKQINILKQETDIL